MKFFLFRYIRSHWRGEASLLLSFWVNFILLFVMLGFLEQFTLPPYLNGEWKVTVATIGFFVVVRGLIYPWQVVGVIRASERYIRDQINRTWAITAQGVVVLSLLVVLATTFSSYQSLLSYRKSLHPPETVESERGYSLELITLDQNEANTLLHLRGPFEIGITSKVKHLLATHPTISGIILDSGGGQIYEGRGLAYLILENSLDTYSLGICASSCTTAFVAGNQRTLGSGARLGFHQYKNYVVLPVIDIDEQHAKDMALFEQQGISSEFLQKIFHRPPDDMWWPSTDELIASGIVHKIDFSIAPTKKLQLLKSE